VRWKNPATVIEKKRFESLEMELLKMHVVKKSKKVNDEQQIYDASFLEFLA
jgi:hypothetical protein